MTDDAATAMTAALARIDGRLAALEARGENDTADAVAKMADALAKIDATLAALQTRGDAPPPEPDWYTVGQAAAKLGKSAYTVREWCRQCRVPCRRAANRKGKPFLIRRADIDQIATEGPAPLRAARGAGTR